MVIKCPSCNHFVSEMATLCPHCGVLLKGEMSSSEVSDIEKQIPERVNNEDNIVDNPLSDQMVEWSNPVQVNEPQVEILQHKNPQEKINQMGASPVGKSDQTPFETHNTVPVNSASVAPLPDSVAYQEAKKNNSTLIAIIILLAVVICGVGGYLYYDNVYLPEKIDREAPRYYSMANIIVLRSSRSAGADFNKVASLPYGTELITYEIDSEWARVKVNSPNGEKQEGYVASSYILNKADFFLMNSIFGNQDSKETVNTTKCRMALLNYFKERHYVGKIDDQMRIDAGISIVPNSENQWQVFTKPKEAKPNSVFYKRLYNRNSHFTDFAVIISNVSTGERKLLYFYFDEDETSHLLKTLPAPSSGYIKDIYMIRNYTDEIYLNVVYTN